MVFGEVVRSLRRSQGLGIKTLAPDLGVTPGYLSKIENELTKPSSAFVQRVANYFEYDEDLLFQAAERLPPDVLEILRQHPDAAIQYLREQFGRELSDDSARVVSATSGVQGVD